MRRAWPGRWARPAVLTYLCPRGVPAQREMAVNRGFARGTRRPDLGDNANGPQRPLSRSSNWGAYTLHTGSTSTHGDSHGSTPRLGAVRLAHSYSHRDMPRLSAAGGTYAPACLRAAGGREPRHPSTRDLCDLCICEALPSVHRHAVRAEPGIHCPDELRPKFLIPPIHTTNLAPHTTVPPHRHTTESHTHTHTHTHAATHTHSHSHSTHTGPERASAAAPPQPTKHDRTGTQQDGRERAGRRAVEARAVAIPRQAAARHGPWQRTMSSSRTTAVVRLK